MKDFIHISISTQLSQKEIHSLLSVKLPEYSWRMGDSDYQGLYITSIGSELGQIQVWLDDEPAVVTISLRGNQQSRADREEWKENLINGIIRGVLPAIGVVGEIKEYD